MKRFFECLAPGPAGLAALAAFAALCAGAAVAAPACKWFEPLRPASICAPRPRSAS